MELRTGPLFNLPFSLDLGDITFRQRHKGESLFIDYESLSESSLILYEDILGLFLVKLKKLLECVQVCWGEIDQWLSTPSSKLRFLQETFGREKLEGSNKTLRHFCIEGSYASNVSVASAST